jgi:hypothetical protein
MATHALPLAVLEPQLSADVAMTPGQFAGANREQGPSGGVASMLPLQLKSKPPHSVRARLKNCVWLGRALVSESQQSSSLSTEPAPGGPQRRTITPAAPNPSPSPSGDQSRQSLEAQSMFWLQTEPFGSLGLTHVFDDVLHTWPLLHWASLVHWTHWRLLLHTWLPAQRSGLPLSAPQAWLVVLHAWQGLLQSVS